MRSSLALVSFAAIEGPDLLIVLLIILVLFGGAKVPQLARSLGQAKREFERGVSESASDEPAPGPNTEARDQPGH
jgi:sec-independent protein translocase protein TatA